MLKFLKTGIQNCGIIYTKKECKTLLKEIYKTRNFKKIFLSKSEYLKGDRSFFKKNPSPGRNLLHKTNCSFIFENNNFNDAIKFLDITVSISPKNTLYADYYRRALNLEQVLNLMNQGIELEKNMD